MDSNNKLGEQSPSPVVRKDEGRVILNIQSGLAIAATRRKEQTIPQPTLTTLEKRVAQSGSGSSPRQRWREDLRRGRGVRGRPARAVC